MIDTQPKPILQLVGVRKTFGTFTAVESIDLDVVEGEFLTIVGPSGSGKTTLLGACSRAWIIRPRATSRCTAG